MHCCKKTPRKKNTGWRPVSINHTVPTKIIQKLTYTSSKNRQSESLSKLFKSDNRKETNCDRSTEAGCNSKTANIPAKHKNLTFTMSIASSLRMRWLNLHRIIEDEYKKLGKPLLTFGSTAKRPRKTTQCVRRTATEMRGEVEWADASVVVGC